MADPITEQQVRHVAMLSRLKLSDSDVSHFAQQLSSIVDYVSMLQELDVEGVEPMAHGADVANVLREDEPGDELTPDAALANAPQRDENFFRVPKVLDGPSA